MKCPHCASSDTVWKAKAGKWECNSCEERFEGDSPENHASVSGGHPMPSAKAAKPKRIFFSYGHDANRDLVDRFKTDLEERGHQVWIDYKQIGTWDDWKGTITRGIHDAELAIAFLSIHSTRDPGVCRNEVAMALQHFGKVYPVLVEQVPQESIPVTIAHLQWPDLSRWREFRDQEDLDFERFYEEKFLEIVSRIEGEAGRFASEAEVLRRTLNPSGFEGRFARHLDGFTGREWVFDAFEHWLDHQSSSRVFWIKAGPGFGKTALAVQMANRHRAAIVGTWFCDHQSVELRDPLRALQTIAYQLALRWDDYRVRLLPRLGLYADSSPDRIEEARKELAKKSLQDLFSFLISEPMAGLIWREHKLVILVDALDEAAEADGTNPLAALISGRFLELPEWIGFVVTSRPDASVLAHLQGFRPFAIEAGDSRNTADLQAYGEDQIGPLLHGIDDAEQERIVRLLVEKSAGMMLYLRLVSEGLKEGTLAVDDLELLDAGLPGLHGRYHAGFEARFGKDFHETVQPLLRLIMAAPGPIPLDLAAEVLEWDRELAVRTRARVGSYLVEDQGGLSLFHKTLGEWLSSESAALYFTDAEAAAKKLGTFLWERFDEREKDAYDLTKPLRWEPFVRDWLPGLLEHIERRNDWDEIEKLALWLFSEKDLWKHAEALYRRTLEGREQTLGLEHPDTLKSINHLGTFLCYIKEDIAEGEVLIRRALEVRERVLGPEHPDTLKSINNLGEFLCNVNGDLAGAEKLYRRALEGLEKAIGLEHSDTLASVYRLGDLLQEIGDLARAEELFRRAFECCEKNLGPGHLDTITSASRFGVFLMMKGDLAKAEALHRCALEEGEKALGLEHPATLSIVNDLRNLLLKKGDLTEAEVLCRRALEGYEKTLGLKHPDTLASVDRLGDLLEEKGDHAGAEVLYQRALEGSHKKYGPEHSISLLRALKLAPMYVSRGDFTGAEVIYRRAMEAKEKKRRPHDPLKFDIITLLAHVLAIKGDFAEAEILHLRALEGQEKALGTDRPDTLSTVHSLGDLLCKKGDYEGAEALYRRALEGYEKTLGLEHPDTLNSVNVLGDLLQEKGDHTAAEALYRRAMEGHEKALGLEHHDTLTSVTNLGRFLQEKGDHTEAELLLRRALLGYEKALEAEHPDTLKSALTLGYLLVNKGDYKEAESLYRRVLDVREKSIGAEHRDTLRCAYALGGILNTLGRRVDAIELLRRFAAISEQARDFVAYNLACYECLEGNIDEAKRLIAAHLEKHPEKKDQALADADFTAIHDWISQI